MKRNKLIKYLDKNSCCLVREGGKHSLYKNTETGNMSTVPRHTESKKICVEKYVKIWGFLTY